MSKKESTIKKTESTKKKKESAFKKWAYKSPVVSTVVLNLVYLLIARGMIRANSFNVLSNGVIVMIAFLFVFLGMTIREIIENGKEVTNTKKQVIWGIFVITIIAVIYYSNIFGTIK